MTMAVEVELTLEDKVDHKIANASRAVLSAALHKLAEAQWGDEANQVLMTFLEDAEAGR